MAGELEDLSVHRGPRTPISVWWKTASWLALVAGVLLVLFFTVKATAPGLLGYRLSPAGFDQITPGMTYTQVERLIGGPPGNYGTHWFTTSHMSLEGSLHAGQGDEYSWSTDDARYEVYFDANGRVAGTHIRAMYSQQP